jgi:hypothetical protein
MAYALSDTCTPNRDRFVGHHLATAVQAISVGRLDRDTKIWSVGQFSRHLTDHNRSMSFGKRTGLNNNRWSGFSVVSGCGDDYHVAPSDRSIGSWASNSDTDSIQLNASSSLF